MVFNSFEFLIFFVIIFFLYWIVGKNSLKIQNIILLLGGYTFYGWSDWRLLSYLIASSTIIFYLGIYIEKTSNEKYKQWLLYLGLAQGIGGLAFFKYFNFFINSLKDAFHQFGISLDVSTLNLLIPIGISFFTFKTISYLLDVNKGKITASKDVVIFFVYVSFFPTILSGPIDRASIFIPQLEKRRVFEYEHAMVGMRQIFWGLFKKVVIADTLSTVVNTVFTGYHNLNFMTLFLGAIVFSVQLYADFCGYSDMAIGISNLIGFNVTPNFNFPFFAENIADFWRRWHMSLTSWLTEYVFTPLSIFFRDYGKFGVIISIIINFVICGIWHGANWTFVLWGLLNGCYFIPLILRGTFNKKKKKTNGGAFKRLKYILNVTGTFILVSLTLILFRSDTISDALGYYRRMFDFNVKNLFQIKVTDINIVNLGYIIALLCVDLWFYNEVKSFKIPKVIRFGMYLFGCSLILLCLNKKESFIYLKF